MPLSIKTIRKEDANNSVVSTLVVIIGYNGVFVLRFLVCSFDEFDVGRIILFKFCQVQIVLVALLQEQVDFKSFARAVVAHLAAFISHISVEIAYQVNAASHNI